jgi:hypothetical protein
MVEWQCHQWTEMIYVRSLSLERSTDFKYSWYKTLIVLRSVVSANHSLNNIVVPLLHPSTLLSKRKWPIDVRPVFLNNVLCHRRLKPVPLPTFKTSRSVSTFGKKCKFINTCVVFLCPDVLMNHSFYWDRSREKNEQYELPVLLVPVVPKSFSIPNIPNHFLTSKDELQPNVDRKVIL